MTAHLTPDWQSEDGRVQLFCGDCLDILPHLSGVDAVITDPPYCSGGVSETSRTAAKGQGLRSENIKRFGWFVGDNMTTSGLVWLLRAVAAESLRACNGSGSVVMFCDWRMVANLSPAIESVGLRYQNLIVWNKGHMGMGTGFRCQHELAMHFTCGAPEYHSKSFGNVITAGRVSGDEREHQTQKPTELMEPIIKVCAAPSGVVLDPFMGSGSTGVASLRVGRKFIGIERDPVHFATARDRIQRELAQQLLPL